MEAFICYWLVTCAKKKTVFGLPLAQSVLKVQRHKQLVEAEREEEHEGNRNQSHKVAARVARKRLKHTRVSEDPNQASMYNENHPFRIGSELFAKSKWIELTEQMRSEDEVHTALVQKLYTGQQLVC